MKIIGDNSDKMLALILAKVVNLLLTDISGKALLYFVPLFLSPFVEKLGQIMLGGNWPTIPALVMCSVIGLIAGCIGLRAFYDGSYQRDKQDQSTKPPTP